MTNGNGDLEGTVEAYPEMRIRHAPPVAWLSSWIWPISGLHADMVGYRRVGRAATHELSGPLDLLV
jgi:hypothetical protein